MTADPLPMEPNLPMEACTRHNRCPDCERETTFDGSPRCNAWSKQRHHRCERARTPGTTVCHSHGSAHPNVRARANLRLLELIDPSLARLAKVVKKGNDADAIRAANSLLDRAGVVRRTDVDPAAATALLVERLREIAEQRAHPVVPGSVVDDDTPGD